MDAFLVGDQSGAVVSRGFVCWAHAFGMLFSPDVDDSPTMLKFYTRRGQIAWENLAGLLETKNYEAALRALIVAASSSTFVLMTQMGIFYVQKCCDMIEAGNLRFTPTIGPPPEYSEDLHENLVALSQTIYWANYLFLMRGGPEPRATVNLEKEFRQELPVGNIASILSHIRLTLPQKAYPILFEICPLTMRTQGILLVRDAILLLSLLAADGERHTFTSSIDFGRSSSLSALGVKLDSFWRQSCDKILAPLEEFSRILLRHTKRFRDHDDKNRADVISSSCIACLAHLAILYEVICRPDPVAGEMYALCDSALQKLGVLTSELQLDEYTYLDLLLAVRPPLPLLPDDGH